MPAKTGTYDLQSLIASQFAGQTVAEFGIERAAEILQANLAAFNAQVRESMLPEMVEVTTQRQRVSGQSTSGEMMEVDQYGAAPTQKEPVAPSLGIPLRLFQYNVGWTEKWMQIKTVADLARRTVGAEIAYLRRIRRDIQRAFYLSANYTFVDRLVDGVSLPVKRLANADGFAIPDGPNGESFDSATHTHYTAEAALTAAGLLASVNTVVEHEVAGPIRTAINTANETAVKALAGFTAAADPRLILATNVNQAEDELDITRLNDRLIGYFGSAEVWVKPWAIANYAVTYDAGGDGKPLALRQREQTALQGLRVAAQNSLFPLTAEFMEAEFGVAVVARTKMAVHYFAGGAYTDPAV